MFFNFRNHRQSTRNFFSLGGSISTDFYFISLKCILACHENFLTAYLTSIYYWQSKILLDSLFFFGKHSFTQVFMLHKRDAEGPMRSRLHTKLSANGKLRNVPAIRCTWQLLYELFEGYFPCSSCFVALSIMCWTCAVDAKQICEQFAGNLTTSVMLLWEVCSTLELVSLSYITFHVSSQILVLHQNDFVFQNNTETVSLHLDEHASCYRLANNAPLLLLITDAIRPLSWSKIIILSI